MLAKKFNKGIGFTIGLILLPTIFLFILAFGKSKYTKENKYNKKLKTNKMHNLVTI